MARKHGHALVRVTLTALFRRWAASLLLIAVSAAGVCSAMVLQNLTARQENALYNTIVNTTISCKVTDAKGADSGNLQMLSAFVEMLEGYRRARGCYLDDYVKNVRAMSQQPLSWPEGTSLRRILSVSSDPALSPVEGASVSFLEGCTEEALKEWDQVCLVPAGMETDGGFLTVSSDSLTFLRIASYMSSSVSFSSIICFNNG